MGSCSRGEEDIVKKKRWINLDMTGQKSTQGRKGEERVEMKGKQTNWKVLKVTKGKKS